MTRADPATDTNTAPTVTDTCGRLLARFRDPQFVVAAAVILSVGVSASRTANVFIAGFALVAYQAYTGDS